MERRSVEAVLAALGAAGVRYLLAGGIAVVAHGHVRLTLDVDLMLDLERENVLRALNALATLGYSPAMPVRMTDFAESATREQWVKEKNMIVFSLFSPRHAATRVDIFSVNPLEFEAAYARRAELKIGNDVVASVVHIDDLIAMKQQVSRPKDLEDVERLRRLKEKLGRD